MSEQLLPVNNCVYLNNLKLLQHESTYTLKTALRLIPTRYRSYFWVASLAGP